MEQTFDDNPDFQQKARGCNNMRNTVLHGKGGEVGGKTRSVQQINDLSV